MTDTDRLIRASKFSQRFDTLTHNHLADFAEREVKAAVDLQEEFVDDFSSYLEAFDAYFGGLIDQLPDHQREDAFERGQRYTDYVCKVEKQLRGGKAEVKTRRTVTDKDQWDDQRIIEAIEKSACPVCGSGRGAPCVGQAGSFIHLEREANPTNPRRSKTTNNEKTLKDEIGGTDLTDEQREAMKDFVREMQKKVIPDIVAAVQRWEELAHLSRLGVMPIIKRLQDERNTENTMYKAWRKRATEAEEREGILEGKLSRLTAERDAFKAELERLADAMDTYLLAHNCDVDGCEGEPRAVNAIQVARQALEGGDKDAR